MNLEHLKHLFNIEMILELSIVLEYLADTGQEFAELSLECQVSKVGHLPLVLDHDLKFVEVGVGLDQLGQGLHCLHVDGVHLWVSSLHVLHVELVPIFTVLDELFFPTGKGLKGELSLHPHGVHEIGDVNHRIFTVEAVHIGCIRKLILGAIDPFLELLNLVPEHGPHVHLLIGCKIERSKII
jgi:hypothetical protein